MKLDQVISYPTGDAAYDNALIALDKKTVHADVTRADKQETVQHVVKGVAYGEVD